MPPLYSLQANGVAERINRTIVERLISLLNQAQAPKVLWAERFLPLSLIYLSRLSLSRTGRCALHSPEAPSLPSGMASLYGSTCFGSGVDMLLVSIGYDGDTAAYRLFDTVTRKTSTSRRTFRREWLSLRRGPAGYRAKLAAACACSRQLDQSCLAPSDANDATPQTPARASPVVQRPSVPSAQARKVVVSPPPSPVFHRASAPLPPSPELVLRLTHGARFVYRRKKKRTRTATSLATKSALSHRSIRSGKTSASARVPLAPCPTCSCPPATNREIDNSSFSSLS